MKTYIYLIPGLLVLAALVYGLVHVPADASSGSALKSEISDIAGPYALKLPSWEIWNLLQPVSNGNGDGRDFGLLNSQIDAVLKSQGMSVLPPVNIRMAKPPLLLVISPRAKIEYFDRLLLSPDLSLIQIERLEDRLDGLGLSSLVTELGGLGAAYPALVNPDMSPRSVMDAASEEWSHQYLALRPLGSLYLLDSLGFSQNPEVIEMNETLAGLMAQEIGDKVYHEYYADSGGAPRAAPKGGFDFNREMRDTRKTVDSYLSAGETDEAERYMDERCLVFQANGYAIRKLNQAYFAFHGIYGQDPAAVSPVHDALVKLREKYTTLSGFVDAASRFTCLADLQDALGDQAGR